MLMNEEELFDKLVTKARAEQPPVVDVTSAVMATVAARSREQAPAPWWPMGWMAALSGAMAAAMLLVSADGWELFQNPLAALMLDLMWEVL